MDQKTKFNNLLQELIASKNINNVYLTKTMYSQILNEVEMAKSKKYNKRPLDYRRLKRYDVLHVVGEESKLICSLKEESTIKYFVSSDQLFDIIHNSHLTTGHGGRGKILKDLNEKYKNITAEAIMLYLSLCEACQQKAKGKRKTIVKPILANELDSRCQVDLIDLQTQPDNDYKFILNYQDCLTKFVVLRPLKTKTASEVAEHLLDIFTLLGAPSILQSNNGRDFANKIITELSNLWDGIKIVHGKPRQSQGSIERANQDVQQMLLTWLTTNKSTKWSEGLKFVQLMKNRSFHEGIKQSPYEALFGTEMKLGLKSSNLPEESLNRIHSEEDLEKFIDGINIIQERQDVEGLEFGHSLENTFLHEGIRQTDSEALLVTTEMTLDSESSYLPEESINHIRSREQLEEVIEEMNIIQPFRDAENIDEKELSKSEKRTIFIEEELVDNVSDQNHDFSPHNLENLQNDSNLIQVEQQTSHMNCNLIERKQKKCLCKGKCASKKCKCKAAELLCNSKCHNSNLCFNR